MPPIIPPEIPEPDTFREGVLATITFTDDPDATSGVAAIAFGRLGLDDLGGELGAGTKVLAMRVPSAVQDVDVTALVPLTEKAIDDLLMVLQKLKRSEGTLVVSSTTGSA